MAHASDDRPAATRSLVPALLLLGVFVAGALAGIGGYRWLAPPPPFAPPGPPRGDLVRDLGLDAAQERAWHAIEQRHRPALQAIVEESKPRVRAIVEGMDAELRTLLTPEQQRRFDALKARRPPPPGLPGMPPPGAPPPPGALPPPPP